MPRASVSHRKSGSRKTRRRGARVRPGVKREALVEEALDRGGREPRGEHGTGSCVGGATSKSPRPAPQGRYVRRRKAARRPKPTAAIAANDSSLEPANMSMSMG